MVLTFDLRKLMTSCALGMAWLVPVQRTPEGEREREARV